MTPLASCSHSLQIMPVARAMRAAAANQIMMLAVNPLSSVCTNVHRDQYCTTRIEFLVILSFTHFYGRAAAELSFSDLVLRTFTRTMKTVISYNNLELYLYYLRSVEYYQSIKNGHGRCSDRCHCYQCRVWDHIQWKQVNFDEVNWQGHAV